MSKVQRHRPNVHKPSVVKVNVRGMWWAQVIDRKGKFLTECRFTQAEALAIAIEYASIVNKEDAK